MSRRAGRPNALVLRALGVGDLLTSVPALRGLRRHFPDHRLVLATAPALKPLVARIGVVDGILPQRGLGPIEWPHPPPEIAINLHGRGPQSHRALLAAHPEELLAFANDEIPRTWDEPEWQPHEHEVDRWCRLLQAHGIQTEPDDLRLDAPPSLPDGPDVAVTIIHPGASSGARRWPASRWGAVASTLRRAGHRVVVTGSRAERSLTSHVARTGSLSDDAHRGGATDLDDLTNLVAHAALVCSGDTGIAHLAFALGTPSVTLYGPVPPAEWGPIIDVERHAVLWAGDTGDPHADAPTPGLLEISVGDVVGAAEQVCGVHRTRVAASASVMTSS